MAASKLPEGELAFSYFPGNYRWSHGVLLALGGAPWGGGEIDEINRIGLRLKGKDGDDTAWFNEWAGEAERIENIGHVEEKKGHKLTAAAYLFRAAHYYQVGERFMQPKTDASQAAYQRAVVAFRKAAGLVTRPRIEHVEVPYEGTSLPGIIVHAEPVAGRKANDAGPVMLFLDGFDVTKEIQYFRGIPDLAARGISCLLLDGPGNGEAIRFRGLTLHHETERHAGAAYDYLAARPEFDPKRIGIMALSLGGYYAPRAAAFEKRFACAVAWGAIFDYHACVADRIGGRGEPSVPGYAEHVNWVFGCDKIEDTLKIVKQMTLEGVADKITCPLLIVHGENDRQVPLWHAERTYAAAVNSPGRELKICRLADGGAEHCGADNGPLVVDYMTDWVAEKLGGHVKGI